MALEADIYSALDAALSVPVYAGVAAQGETSRERVTFERISTRASNTLGGNAGKDFVRVQVDSWSATYAGALATAAAARAAMEAASFKALLDGQSYYFEPDTLLHRVSTDYNCLETVPRSGV